MTHLFIAVDCMCIKYDDENKENGSEKCGYL